MDIYAENILDHFRNPRNHGEPQDCTVVQEESNIECGDKVKVWLKLSAARSEKSKRIERIGWEGTGCAISQASMSILSEELEGQSDEDVEKLTKEDVYKLLGVPIGPRRFKCALMSLHAVKNALRKARGLPLQSWAETINESRSR
jgi:nitrogen fixation NifU-like protein